MNAIRTARVPRLTIGGLSEQTGCNIETIRYYERIGLLQSPARTEGGHRIYCESDLKRLTFIRRSRELGFTLEEIRALLRLLRAGDYTCAEVQAITLEHLENVRGKIADLRRLEKLLARTVAQCQGGTAPECPVIDALFQSA